MSISKLQIKTIAVICGLCLFSAGFIGYVIYQNEENKVEQAVNNGMYFEFVSDQEETIEYGADIQAEEFVKDYKGTLEVPELNTKQVGTQKLTYILDYGGYETEYTKTVHIKDTEKPTLKALKGTSFTIKQGESLPFSEEDFEAVDPVDGKCKVSFVGKVNTNIPGTYHIQAVAQDKNKNSVQKTVDVKVENLEQKDILDYSLGTELDAYTRIDANTVQVRGYTIQVSPAISNETLEFFVKQFNLCPNFLLASVDSFYILPEDEFKEVTKNKENVIGYHQVHENKRTVYLLEQTNKDDVLIHECSHAFSTKYKVTSTKEFNSAYRKEKNNFNEYAKMNKEEFFAYTFTEYLMNGYDALYEKCPKTAITYKEMEL